MGNKSSTSSHQNSPKTREKQRRADSTLPIKHSFPKAKEKIKYFRKIANCDTAKTIQVLRKRCYDLASVTLEKKNHQPHVLKQILKGQKSIRTLKVPNEEFLRKRMSSLQYLRNLQVDSIRRITEESIQNFLKFLWSGFSSLNRLSLDFSVCSHLPKKGSRVLTSRFGRSYRSLKFLDLNLSGSKMTDEGFNALVMNMERNLRSLKGLKFNFNLCTHLSDQALKTIISKLGNSLNQLKGFELELGYCDITNDSIKSFATRKDYKKLKRLGLNFTNCFHITDEGFNALVSNIGSNLKRLKHFSLSCPSKISENAVRNLAFMIDNLHNLQSLILNLKYCEGLTDQSLKFLSSKIGLKRKELHSLNLDFSFAWSLTDEGITNISNEIASKCIGLQKMDLNFDNCRQITGQGVYNLTSVIADSLKSLRHLNLNFNGCSLISEEVLEALSLDLGSLKKLQVLFLEFSTIPYFSDRLKRKVIYQVGNNLKTIPDFTFVFGFYSVTRDNLDDYRQL